MLDPRRMLSWANEFGRRCCRGRWREHRAGPPSNAAGTAGVQSSPAAASNPATRASGSRPESRSR
jgi:hypothetical protein